MSWASLFGNKKLAVKDLLGDIEKTKDAPERIKAHLDAEQERISRRDVVWSNYWAGQPVFGSAMMPLMVTTTMAGTVYTPGGLR